MDIISQYKEDFPVEVNELIKAAEIAKIRRARIADEHMILSVGIMGQVKAGKSSFLNSLLFNGKALLPEAATPKTANLTRIRYAEKPRFTAHFYSESEWKNIEDYAQSNAHDDRTKAAQELLYSAQCTSSNINDVLAKKKIEITADSVEELLGQLNEYTGSDGRLTALVAETELALPVDLLRGIEIVDTPGMNDPVISRTEKTRDYMSKCDVVFFLSRASQFLDSNDTYLISSQLPQNGIKRLIIVGSQFDMAVMDDGSNHASLDLCIKYLRETLSRHASRVFQDLAIKNLNIGKEKLSSLLNNLEMPIFSSTHAWQILHTSTINLTESVQHTIQEVDYISRKSWKNEMTREDWRRIANWEPQIEALKKSRLDKDAILQEQRINAENEIIEQEKNLKRLLREQSSIRREILLNKDLESLAAQEESQKKKLNHIVFVLSNYLHETINLALKRESEIVSEMNAGAQRASNLHERTGYRQDRTTYQISDATWYKPWTWFSTKTEGYTTTQSYKYLILSDAVENFKFYVKNTRHQMLGIINNTISPKSISAGLRRELMREVELDSTDFDAKGVALLVESFLLEFELPTVDFEEPNLSLIFENLPCEITNNSEMRDLRSRLNLEIKNINNTLQMGLNESVRYATENLTKKAESLRNLLTKKLEDELTRSRKDMADKESQIQRLDILIKHLSF